MELSKPERWILSNQYRILEKLYPKEAKNYSEERKAIERGYSLHYDSITQYIEEGLNKNQCDEVMDILDMYRILKSSVKKLKIRDIKIKFPGFDGNNEGEQLGYVRYLIEDLNRFIEIKKISESPNLNSHHQTLELYRRMLDEWDKCKNKYDPTKEEIERILEVHIK